MLCKCAINGIMLTRAENIQICVRERQRFEEEEEEEERRGGLVIQYYMPLRKVTAYMQNMFKRCYMQTRFKGKVDRCCQFDGFLCFGFRYCFLFGFYRFRSFEQTVFEIVINGLQMFFRKFNLQTKLLNKR